MKGLFRWLGFFVVGIWVATFLVAITMMWHPTWMSDEQTPVSEIVTVALHIFATLLGIVLGPALLFEKVRSQLNGFQIVSFVLGFLLSLATTSRLI